MCLSPKNPARTFQFILTYLLIFGDKALHCSPGWPYKLHPPALASRVPGLILVTFCLWLTSKTTETFLWSTLSSTPVSLCLDRFSVVFSLASCGFCFVFPLPLSTFCSRNRVVFLTNAEKHRRESTPGRQPRCGPALLTSLLVLGGQDFLSHSCYGSCGPFSWIALFRSKRVSFWQNILIATRGWIVLDTSSVDMIIWFFFLSALSKVEFLRSRKWGNREKKFPTSFRATQGQGSGLFLQLFPCRSPLLGLVQPPCR